MGAHNESDAYCGVNAYYEDQTLRMARLRFGFTAATFDRLYEPGLADRGLVWYLFEGFCSHRKVKAHAPQKLQPCCVHQLPISC